MLQEINDFIWTCLLIFLLIVCGLWFTWKTKFIQFRMIGEMFRLLLDSGTINKEKDNHDFSTGNQDDAASGKKPKKKHITSFQAFAISLATRVGTGNMAGVATAIAVGGPGACFWMWVIALIGSATAFVESTLAQLYKRPNKDSFIGGPAYYISKGLHSKWMAWLFAVLITLTFGLSYNSIQSNTICSAMEHAFGWNHVAVGVVITTMALLIVFGGIQRIAKVSSVIVPIMAVGYLLLALFVVCSNISEVPKVFKVIIDSAFGWNQAIGGTIGAAMMNGVKRGLFSNEAGEGSAPNVAATADVSHPVKQGLIQALGVFTDTLVVCSCTAFIILISGLYNTPELNGIQLTQTALQSEVGQAGTVFVAIAIFLFAFSSIIGNYYYGEANIQFMTSNRWALFVYRLCSAGVVVVFGALASLDTVWTLGDICMAVLTFVNIIAILCLGKYVFRLADDYRSQRKQGIKDPVFRKEMLSEINNDLEAW